MIWSLPLVTKLNEIHYLKQCIMPRQVNNTWKCFILHNSNFFIYVFHLLDPLVKVYIKMGDKKLKKRSTVVKKHDVPPVWNEAFSFAIPHRILHKVAVLLQVKHFSERGKKRLLGKVVIGSTANDEAVDHWNAMLTASTSIAKWHSLEEEKPSVKKSKTPTKQKATWHFWVVYSTYEWPTSRSQWNVGTRYHVIKFLTCCFDIMLVYPTLSKSKTSLTICQHSK